MSPFRSQFQNRYLLLLSALLVMLFSAVLPVLAEGTAGSSDTGETYDSNQGTAWSIRKNYFLRYPVAKENGPSEAGGHDVIKEQRSEGPGMVQHHKSGPVYIWPEIHMTATSQVPTKRDESINDDMFQTFGLPVSDTQFQIIDRYNDNRMLECLYDPERLMWLSTAIGNIQASAAANSTANLERNQAQTAIDFNDYWLPNFTKEKGNIWNRIRDKLFVPMGLLLLLTGAVITQVRAIVAAGFSSILGDMNPFEGILRAIVGVFLVFASYLVVNYGIDVSNSIKKTISDGYQNIFGSNMYDDAKKGHKRAFPIRDPNDNANAMDKNGKMGIVEGGTPVATSKLEGASINVADENNKGVPDREDERVPSLTHINRLLLNSYNTAATASWNVLGAFQIVYLHYLFVMGPIVAGIWVFPIGNLRQALGSWVEGVITICFWSLFWNTSILLMACFYGVSDTGTVIFTALNSLAVMSVRYAFNFSGLVAAAGQAAAQKAQQAMAGGGAGGHGGAASHGGSAGGSAGGKAGGAGAAQTKGGEQADGKGGAAISTGAQSPVSTTTSQGLLPAMGGSLSPGSNLSTGGPGSPGNVTPGAGGLQSNIQGGGAVSGSSPPPGTAYGGSGSPGGASDANISAASSSTGASGSQGMAGMAGLGGIASNSMGHQIPGTGSHSRDHHGGIGGQGGTHSQQQQALQQQQQQQQHQQNLQNQQAAQSLLNQQNMANAQNQQNQQNMMGGIPGSGTNQLQQGGPGSALGGPGGPGQGLPLGPDGKPLSPLGPPPSGIDGKPLPLIGGIGPDGKPIAAPLGPDGKPLLGPPMGPDGKPIDFGGQGSALSSQIPSTQVPGVSASSSMPSSYPTAGSSQQYLYYDNSQSQSQGQYYAYSYQGYGQAYGYDQAQAQYYPYQGQGQAYYYDGNAQQYNHYPAQIQQYDSSGHYVAQASQQQYYADTSGSSVAGSDYGAPVNYGSYARESNVNEGNIIGSLQGQMQAYNNYSAGPAPHAEPAPQPYQAPPPPQDVQPYMAYQAPQVAPQQAPPPPPPQPQAPPPPQPRVQIPIVPAFNKLAGNANMGRVPQGGSGAPTDSSGKTNAQNKALQQQMDINRRAAAEAEQLAKEEEEKRRRKEKEKEDKDRK